jgi:hypothetical protein
LRLRAQCRKTHVVKNDIAMPKMTRRCRKQHRSSWQPNHSARHLLSSNFDSKCGRCGFSRPSDH